MSKFAKGKTFPVSLYRKEELIDLLSFIDSPFVKETIQKHYFSLNELKRISNENEKSDTYAENAQECPAPLVTISSLKHFRDNFLKTSGSTETFLLPPVI